MVWIVDSSVDEQKLLVFAGSGDDPDHYLLYDRATKQLHPLVAARSELEGVRLAKMKPITYPVADEMLPGCLTLPPGMEEAKGLPAIVLPHGGPSARDEWDFD